jgi:hypothetical protein
VRGQWLQVIEAVRAQRHVRGNGERHLGHLGRGEHTSNCRVSSSSLSSSMYGSITA